MEIEIGGDGVVMEVVVFVLVDSPLLHLATLVLKTY